MVPQDRVFTTSLIDQQKEFIERKIRSRNTIKNEIGTYLKEVNEHPTLLFIDNLDRCSPEYIVSFLECLESVLSLDQLIIVLGIYRKQLCVSLSNYYGGESFESNRFLSKYIDLEFKLAPPSLVEFIKKEIKEYEFSEIFIKDDFIEICEQLIHFFNLSLREIKQIFLKFALLVKQDSFDEQFAIFSFFMTLLKGHSPELFESYQNKSLSGTELVQKLELQFPKYGVPLFNSYESECSMMLRFCIEVSLLDEKELTMFFRPYNLNDREIRATKQFYMETLKKIQDDENIMFGGSIAQSVETVGLNSSQD